MIFLFDIRPKATKKPKGIEKSNVRKNNSRETTVPEHIKRKIPGNSEKSFPARESKKEETGSKQHLFIKNKALSRKPESACFNLE